MSYHEKLEAEINTYLSELEAKSEPLIAAWITHAVCNDHASGLADNEHAEFWQHGGYRTTRELVRRCINSRAGDDAERGTRQQTLPGFEHLQTHYMVRRNGDEIGVPVHDLTEAEIDEKVELYRSFAKANFAHANELRRFKELRAVQPVPQKQAELA